MTAKELGPGRPPVAAGQAVEPVDAPWHGTTVGYVSYQCRCERCVEANRKYHRDYWRTKRSMEAARSSPEGRVAAALRMRKMGRSNGEIADVFGVHVVTVSNWFKRLKMDGVEVPSSAAPKRRKKLKNRTRAERIADLKKALEDQ